MKISTTWGSLLLLAISPLALTAEESRKVGLIPSRTESTVPDARLLLQTDRGAIPPAGLRTLGNLAWHTDYTDAYRQAQAERKMLLIFFRDDRTPQTADAFEGGVLASAELHELFGRTVRVILPVDVLRPQTDPQAPAARLLDHVAFEHMYRRQGLAMIDLADPESDLYGQVVSAHPFTSGKQYTVRGTKIILGLPRASLTQRALIYAVRLHPEAPPCTNGKCHPFVLKQAHLSSKLMVQYQSVGHHDWGTRSAEISAATGHSGMEVAAMSYSSTTLIDAAIEIVAMWQGSPTHWGMMSAPAAIYGFDMVRAPGGQWYGTGIFAN